ncbi:MULTISPECIES: hypothetical protein [unclassified Rhizobium]|uniref:hypothetical protein n=1 Tax=unclassified Rhizobium TaxID=2613769 RepID=UPI001ADBDAD9|nr:MULTISPECIES: hypothetical protein [unclassified Rhizobium]MBO9101707.1 hypothetical protein [Rhizobium sp. L58/93]MBO9172458.1 hypothetical protein [Rhizobium sp. L245/93]MBO9187042.1 hypothetical protein [Rhizobium sp. E27B/91]QXZ86124.1 hypothetical protein J5287_23830 [Rhizobium sp. K1/93]QXZ92420.1 hypothetical protein J5280_25360 [Rhizobium sp. K15/93]
MKVDKVQVLPQFAGEQKVWVVAPPAKVGQDQGSLIERYIMRFPAPAISRARLEQLISLNAQSKPISPEVELRSPEPEQTSPTFQIFPTRIAFYFFGT